MNTRRDIRRFWLWVAILLVTELSVFTLWKRWQWLIPDREVSGLYQRYAGTDGLNTAFVKDYRIDDTTAIDVTLLEATSDSAWTLLQRDFNLHTLPSELSSSSDSNKVVFRYAPRDNYALPMDTVLLNNDLVVISHYRRTVMVFAIESEKHINALFDYKLLTHKITIEK